MENKTTILFALILLVFSGCQGGFGTNKEQTPVDNSHIGTNGVVLNFVQQSPPTVAFDGNPLDVVVELRNQGATEATLGKLYLTGYDSRIFPFDKQFADFDLEPRTKYNLVGGYSTASFHANAIRLPPGTDVFDQKLQATACYMYRTEARIPVCIDPNPNSVLENKVCHPTNPSVGGGQGAPVAVTAVREDPAPGRVNFLITIANSGGGTIIAQNAIDNCLQPKFNEVDRINYAVRLSGATGNCEPLQTVMLANKQGSLYCRFTLLDYSTNSPAYQSILELDLDYGYSSQLSKTVRVQSITG